MAHTVTHASGQREEKNNEVGYLHALVNASPASTKTASHGILTLQNAQRSTHIRSVWELALEAA
ncbi:MAG TPA: hypothetical protein VI488_19745 [Candidatus Angelobacter sp.]